MGGGGGGRMLVLFPGEVPSIENLSEFYLYNNCNLYV